MTLFNVLSIFSGSCFLFYGFSCLFSKRMALEFERFRIPQYLNLTGILQILGGLALLVGFRFLPFLAFLGAMGLSVLMLMGSVVRIKIKDNFVSSAPAFIFAFLNAYLAYRFFLIL